MSAIGGDALAFRDLLIVPYTDLLDSPRGGLYHRGGPRWPAWSAQVSPRHCQLTVPVDTEPPEGEPVSRLAGTWAWCGPVQRHYGHQIADFSMRLFATLAARPHARIVTMVNPATGIRSYDGTPVFYRQILDWVGVEPRLVRVESEACLVDEVIVVPQQEQLPGPGPSGSYLDLMDFETRRRLGVVRREGVLYVSRAGMYSRFAGEEYVEAALAAAGVRVIRPESLPLGQQLRLYASAGTIVFAEGSAIHTTQLLGRSLGHVVVLARLSGAWVGEASLVPRSASLRYEDVRAGIVHGLDLAGDPAEYYGLIVLREARLLEVFDGLGVPLRAVWDPRSFEVAVRRDALQWLAQETRSPRASVPGSLAMIRAGLASSGLGDLMGVADGSA